MTRRKDLKNRARQRQQQTGERYATARAQVVAQRESSSPSTRPGPSLVVELEDVPAAIAGPRGLRVPVRASPALGPHLGRVLDELARILDGRLAALEPLARALRLGDLPSPSGRGSPTVWFTRWREFLRGAALGFRCPGPGGLSVIFDVDGGGERRTVLAHLVIRPGAPSFLLLSLFAPTGPADDPLSLWSAWLGAG
jgi:hypothetical protein